MHVLVDVHRERLSGLDGDTWVKAEAGAPAESPRLRWAPLTGTAPISTLAEQPSVSPGQRHRC